MNGRYKTSATPPERYGAIRVGKFLFLHLESAIFRVNPYPRSAARRHNPGICSGLAAMQRFRRCVYLVFLVLRCCLSYGNMEAGGGSAQKMKGRQGRITRKRMVLVARNEIHRPVGIRIGLVTSRRFRIFCLFSFLVLHVDLAHGCGRWGRSKNEGQMGRLTQKGCP